MLTKICRVCKEVKSLSAFGVDRSKKDNINTRCLVCHNKACRQTRQDIKVGKTVLHLRPVAIDKTKRWCTTCKDVKPLTEFSKANTRIDGYNDNCKSCNSLSYKKSAINLKQNNIALFKHKSCMRALKTDYGITEIEFQAIMNDQKGCCAICGIDFSELQRRADVDLCHITKQIRGLLCSDCNILLGKAKEDRNILFNAVTYLDSREYERAEKEA